jgi:uncharacterized membrane protein
MTMRITEKINGWSIKKKIFLLILITVIVHITLIIIDTYWISETTIFGEQCDIKCDLYRYAGRAETVLRGDLLYRDVHTETPPLITYLFMIPTAFASSALSFQIFLTFFNVLTILLLFFALKDIDENLAFLSSLLYLIIPLTTDSAIFVIQDEPIVAFFFLLPVVLVRWEKRTYAALIIGLGIWIKAFPLLLLPILLIKDKSHKERLLHLGIIGGISILITLPYFLLCPDDFLQFLRFYVIGKEGIEGISFWRFGIYEVFGNGGKISLFILLGGMGAVYLWLYKAKKSIWKSCIIVILAFFVLYRKIHSNYFLYPLVLLTPFHFMDKAIRWRLWALIIMVISLQPFAGPLGTDIIPFVPAIISFGVIVLLILLIRKIIEMPSDIPDYSTISSIAKLRLFEDSK